MCVMMRMACVRERKRGRFGWFWTFGLGERFQEREE